MSGEPERSDSSRLAELEQRVSLLMSERAVLGSLVVLLDGLFTVLEAERLHYKDRPSLVEMLENSDVVRSMRERPGSLHPDVDRARESAVAFLQALRNKLPLDPRSPVKGG